MYKKIADYGLIGDMNSVALVSRDGSIDYCSMPYLDSPTIFAALLDDEKGGFFSIQPQGEFSFRHEYLPSTNILFCDFETKTGKAKLFDYMPIDECSLQEGSASRIHRCLKVIEGNMDFVLKCVPRPQYAKENPKIMRKENSFVIEGKQDKFILRIHANAYTVDENADQIVARFSFKDGEHAHFDLTYGYEGTDDLQGCQYVETEKFWKNWSENCIADKCLYLGKYTQLVRRSLLALKLLTFKSTGAIAAAATTSLPEELGGERNWDYRFTWIRDASFTLKALFNVGHIHEADGFIRWLHETYRKHGSRDLQIMYSLKGESSLTEEVLGHLKGYRDSAPVRVGNAAYEQRQWDIYGEIMDTAIRISDYAGKIDGDLWPFLNDICNLAVKNWSKPDDGIWEVRNGPFHFVYSKVMCWVALDRGIKIAKRYGFPAPVDKWESERDKIKEEVLKKGFNEKLNSFVQYYGTEKLDASLLLIPIMGFLPFDDPRIVGTIDACQKHLLRHGFVFAWYSLFAFGVFNLSATFILIYLFGFSNSPSFSIFTKLLSNANAPGKSCLAPSST